MTSFFSYTEGHEASSGGYWIIVVRWGFSLPTRGFYDEQRDKRRVSIHFMCPACFWSSTTASVNQTVWNSPHREGFAYIMCNHCSLITERVGEEKGAERGGQGEWGVVYLFIMQCRDNIVLGHYFYNASARRWYVFSGCLSAAPFLWTQYFKNALRNSYNLVLAFSWTQRWTLFVKSRGNCDYRKYIICIVKAMFQDHLQGILSNSVQMLTRNQRWTNSILCSTA